MDNTLLQPIKNLQATEQSMLSQLYEWCAINSGSDNLIGLTSMLHTLTKAFEPLADEIQVLTPPAITTLNLSGAHCSQATGNILYIRKRPHLPRRILLSGHMDTVYSASSPFQHVKPLDDKTLINGPGVADMKGGLIVILHALLAFEQTTQAKAMGWDVFINADEEIGSLGSRVFFNDILRSVQAALVYEPAMDQHGNLAKNRKGNGKLTLVAKGKAAHAGRAFFEGRNAIIFLAEILLAIHALNYQQEGITFNIGQIAGGEALNQIPEKAVAKIDIRISKPEDEKWVRHQLQTIFLNRQREGHTIESHLDFGRPVKRVNHKTIQLFSRVQHLAKKLNIHLDWCDSGGCCDGNNFAVSGLPVLDTLGVRGGNLHSQDEFMVTSSLVERASLSTLLLMELAQGGLEELNT